jgi:hypothetical protein
MTNTRESFKVEMDELGDRLTKLVHEGNVRKVIVKRENETLAEFPLTAGVIGAVAATVIAPAIAAIGAIAALVANCTVEIERTDEKPDNEEPPAAE